MLHFNLIDEANKLRKVINSAPQFTLCCAMRMI